MRRLVAGTLNPDRVVLHQERDVSFDHGEPAVLWRRRKAVEEAVRPLPPTVSHGNLTPLHIVRREPDRIAGSQLGLRGGLIALECLFTCLDRPIEVVSPPVGPSEEFIDLSARSGLGGLLEQTHSLIPLGSRQSGLSLFDQRASTTHLNAPYTTST
jgi:hypothetical protein